MADGQKKGFSLNFGELAVDKAIDLVLIFVGLYAALAVQGWQDARKEKEDYVKLLASFKTEIIHNEKERGTVEKDLGPVEKKIAGENLGPLETRFEKFREQSELATESFECLKLMIDLAQGLTSPSKVQKMQECQPILEKASKEFDSKEARFKPINLAPVYRDDVWQLYLAGGVRYFQNKDLAIKIGAIYSKLKVVEKVVAEVETTFNESFAKQIGEVEASVAELEELMPDDDASEAESTRELTQNGRAISTKLDELSDVMRDAKFEANKTESIIELKVERLKTHLEELVKMFEDVQKELDQEIAKVG